MRWRRCINPSSNSIKYWWIATNLRACGPSFAFGGAAYTSDGNHFMLYLNHWSIPERVLNGNALIGPILASQDRIWDQF